jgi:hypothetical protein
MERMCMIGIAVIYPDSFAVVDLIVRGEQFEDALDVVSDIQEMLEVHDDYMNTFNPEKDFVIELDSHGIEAYVLRYITDTSEVSLDTDNVREFFIDLDR